MIFRTKYFVAAVLLVALHCFGANVRDSLVVKSSAGLESPVGLWKNKNNSAPVAVWFHGGMTSGNCKKGLVAGDDLAGLLPEYTVISVSACRDRHWVTPTAVEWVDAALDSVATRRKNPVDEVYLLGVSDGALGVIVYSTEGRRKISARLLISSFGKMLGEAPSVANIPKVKSGKWLFLQGGADRLYSPQESVPWIETFCKNVGVECDLKYDPQGEHDWLYWKNNYKDWILKVFKEK